MAGTLSATISTALAATPVSAGFSSAGLLDVASVTPIYALSAALSSAGALTAPTTARYDRAALLAGVGVLSATGMQLSPRAAALTATGALSATITTVPQLTIVGVNINNGNSAAFVPYLVGDLLVVYAYKAGLGTVITKPTAGGTVPAYNDIDRTAGANSNASATVWFKATATNHTSGAWASADYVITVVLRGQHPTSPIGGHAEAGSTSVGTVGVVAPAITMSNTSGSSILLHFFGRKSPLTPQLFWSAAPAGYTQQAQMYPNATPAACLDTKDVTTSDGAVTQPCSDTGAIQGYRGATVEILPA